MNEEQFEYNNEEEAEIAQILNIQSNMAAIAKVRDQIKTGPSLSECEECGAEIPLARQQAIQGCTLCIDCQSINERKSRFYAVAK